jgi:hypothetical protein
MNVTCASGMGVRSTADVFDFPIGNRQRAHHPGIVGRVREGTQIAGIRKPANPKEVK